MPWNNGGPGPWGNPAPAETATRSPRQALGEIQAGTRAAAATAVASVRIRIVVRGVLAARSAVAADLSAAVRSAAATAGPRPADRPGPGLYPQHPGRRFRPRLRRRRRSAASPTAVAWFSYCWPSSCSGSAAASTACSRTSRAWCCASAPIPTGPRPVCIGTCPGRSKRSNFPPSPASTAPRSATAPAAGGNVETGQDNSAAATSWPKA